MTAQPTASRPDRAGTWRQLAWSVVVAATVSALVCFLALRILRPAPTGPSAAPVRVTLPVEPEPALLSRTSSTPDLQPALAALKRKVQQLENDLNSTLRVTLTDIGSARVALLDAFSPKYATLLNNTGVFLLSVQGVDPVAGGYRLHLIIGNPMSMVYNGFKLKVRYGEALVREFPFEDDLQPGFWRPVEITLTPATEEDLHGLELSLETNRVRLLK